MNPLIKRIYDAREYQKQKGWEKTYWAIDLHNTIIKSTHKKVQEGDKPWRDCYPYAIESLKELSLRKDICLILYTSSFQKEIDNIDEWFISQGINFQYVNNNPECPNTEYADFNTKFYFDVLIDDKAGFDPNLWEDIYRELLGLKGQI